MINRVLDLVPGLRLYRAASSALTPFARLVLKRRARQGKEEAQRLDERLGFAALDRPPGRLVWLHGASLGECLSLIPLVDRLLDRGVEVLVTSGTVAAAQLLAARLPIGAMHQYAPVDAPKFVERFLDHWRPDIALFAESEIWPNMVDGIHARGVPLILVNARISRRSADRWRKAPGGSAALFRKIDLCLAQNPEDAARFLSLGAPRARVAGNLKFDVPPLPASGSRLAELSACIGGRPVFAAASTHESEEDTILAAHLLMREEIAGLLTIIAPRHPERGEAIAAAASAMGLSVARRSQHDLPAPDSDLYIVDAIGELGLVYRVAEVAFIGKSLSDAPGASGGQNPIEPAKLGCAILHGPHVDNFADVFARLNEAKAAARVTDSASLARAAAYLLAAPARMRKMGRAGAEAVERLSGASRNILDALEPYLAQLAAERASPDARA